MLPGTRARSRLLSEIPRLAPFPARCGSWLATMSHWGALAAQVDARSCALDECAACA